MVFGPKELTLEMLSSVQLSQYSILVTVKVNAVVIVKRAAGIEPASSAWKAEVLPLNYARRNCVKQGFKSLA
ncbi:hypothetical protein PMYN1_Chma84 (chromatophore) [Paulinella micropora]|uniref:Uncharacterized protein n=1 Tax=Paulinella micropora TaxID=1928728 RepID=A0A5K7W0X5_9EUKA|nr:hypothetical protein PMYN1_Chma84 [Paulinella micropora]